MKFPHCGASSTPHSNTIDLYTHILIFKFLERSLEEGILLALNKAFQEDGTYEATLGVF